MDIVVSFTLRYLLVVFACLAYVGIYEYRFGTEALIAWLGLN